jgi:hypothetical protein
MIMIGKAEAESIWPRNWFGGKMLRDSCEVVQPVRMNTRIHADSRRQITRPCLQRALDDGCIHREDGRERGVRADGGLEERIGHFEGMDAACEQRV